MKEKYTKPTVELHEFAPLEVLTTSYSDIKKDDNIVDGSDGW